MNRRHDDTRRKRLPIGVALVVTVVLGLACKGYTGPGSGWTVPYGAGVMYATFWTLLVAFIRPNWSAWRIAVGVFVACCLIEVSQLWHPQWLGPIRRTFIGAAILGSSFSVLDIPHYALGCALGWVWIVASGKGRIAAPCPSDS